MNKIKELFESFKNKEGNTKKKVENLIFFLVMLVLVVVGINYIWFNEPDVENSNDTSVVLNNKMQGENIVSTNSTANDNLEQKLQSILSKMKGVSNVSVLVTYSNNTKIVPIYNVEDSQTTTNETDTQGGKRDITEKSYTKEVVFEEKNSGKNVIVETQLNPTVSGVIIVANYGNDINIKQKIISAVATVTNISEYKVQVLEGT